MIPDGYLAPNGLQLIRFSTKKEKECQQQITLSRMKKDSLYKPLLRKFRKAIKGLLRESGLTLENKLP